MPLLGKYCGNCYHIGMAATAAIYKGGMYGPAFEEKSGL